MPLDATPSDRRRPGASPPSARPAGAYLLLQGVAVAVWWSALSASEVFRAWFELGDRTVLDGYLLPDVAFAAASVAAGVLAVRGRPSAVVLAATTLGAVLYSTLSTFAHVAASGSGTIGAVAMTGASAGTGAALLVLRRTFP